MPITVSQYDINYRFKVTVEVTPENLFVIATFYSIQSSKFTRDF